MPSPFSQTACSGEDLHIQHFAASSAKAMRTWHQHSIFCAIRFIRWRVVFPAGEGGLAGMERNSLKPLWFFVLATISNLTFISHALNNPETKTSSPGAQQILTKGVLKGHAPWMSL